MRTVTPKSLNKSVNTPENFAYKRIEAERMHDVMLLVQNLANKEETTVKLILDCLYDVGSVNLINQKLKFRPLNRTMILITRMSKPVFRVFAWHWFKKNCPQLIANWLRSQVAFEYPKTIPQEIATKTLEIQPYSLLNVNSLSQEIQHLRRQVRWLAGISIVAFSALGVTITTLNPGLAPLQSRQQIESINTKNFPNFTSKNDCKSSNLTICDR
ncbi:MAG: hypothetical protein ACHBN1_25015 [Heteroscytonema crispum UTEX LB 1556]